ncbi:hypothetical protein MHH52_02260 [Paenibacillus sp. FSL K6-0276]|uniref:hypothetical protein n=1 Tax=unclassified Paenibacillus TaxID=185978 RepID=UPI0028B0B453|nr:hypothetical protein [Paenibacillus sp.]
MNKIPDYDIPSIRLTSGMYALTKLACAGLTYVLISLLMLGFPQNNGVPEGWPLSVPYAIYAYGLPAALVADVLLRILRTTSPVVSLVVYVAAGFGAGLWLAAEQGAELLLWGLGGILGLLLLRVTQLGVERSPLLLPVFALFLPLLCLLLL